MTTILADAKLGIMVSDSNSSDGERCGTMRKVWRIKGCLVGASGTVSEIEAFLNWWKTGEKAKFSSVFALVMFERKLLYFAGSDAPIHIQSGREAVGTGAMAAMAAYEALGWKDPRKAVTIACKHDANSRSPVRLYQLKTTPNDTKPKEATGV